MNRRGFLKALAGAGGAVVAGKYLALADETLAKVGLEGLEGGYLLTDEEAAALEGEIGHFENFRFIESHEYGRVLPYHGSMNGGDLPFVRKVLRADARTVLPRGTPYELIAKLPGDYGRDKAIAWFYSPSIRGKPRLSLAPHLFDHGRLDQARGLFVLERGVI